MSMSVQTAPATTCDSCGGPGGNPIILPPSPALFVDANGAKSESEPFNVCGPCQP